MRSPGAAQSRIFMPRVRADEPPRGDLNYAKPHRDKHIGGVICAELGDYLLKHLMRQLAALHAVFRQHLRYHHFNFVSPQIFI